MSEQPRRLLQGPVQRMVLLDADGNETAPDFGSTAPIPQVWASPVSVVKTVCAWATECAQGMTEDGGVYVHMHTYDPPLTEQDVIDFYSRET